MRILLAHSFYRIPGGEDRAVRQQADLLARNHVVELLSEKNEDLDEHITVGARMLFSPKKKKEVAQAITRFGPDIVHIHNVYPSLGPAMHLAANEASVPLVMTVHNYRLRCPNSFMFTEGSVCHRCQKGNYFNGVLHRCFPSIKQSAAYASVLWLHRFVVRLEEKVSLFVTPSVFFRDRLLEWGVSSGKVVVIPNFVHPRALAQPTPGEFGVFVGRLSSEKGVDLLLEALKIAGDPPFRIIGDGPLEGPLRDRAMTLRLNNTSFLGRVPPNQVDDALRGSRFLVMPSLGNENCPMAALEAMALGRPLLVTSRGGLPELVRNGTGLVSRPGDPQHLADQIEKLMTDDSFCHEAGMRALSVSRREFSPDTHLARLEAAYSACIERFDPTR